VFHAHNKRAAAFQRHVKARISCTAAVRTQREAQPVDSGPDGEAAQTHEAEAAVAVCRAMVQYVVMARMGGKGPRARMHAQILDTLADHQPLVHGL